MNICKINALRFLLPAFLAVFGWLAGCTYEEKQHIFDLEDVKVNNQKVQKSNAKSDIEYLSVAYSDLFGETISNDELNLRLNTYVAVGDKQAVMDMFIRNMLNIDESALACDAPSRVVPCPETMRETPEQFIAETYKKFFVREPSLYELEFWKRKIEESETLTPELVYYAFMTSKEYRYY